MIITSLLDTDLYKFTMMQAVLHQFPGAQVEYKFKCRNPGVQLAPYVQEIRDEVRALCQLQFQEAELAYLRSLRFVKSDFVDFLSLFRLNEKYITITPLDNGEIDISIKGPWLHVIPFEIPVLAIVNELYFRRLQTADTLPEGRRRLQAKMERLRAVKDEPVLAHPFELSDFGLRRRFSEAWHREVVATMTCEVPQWFKGTSSVLLAKELDIVPIGTMAHEYMQSFQSQGVRLRDFQKAALEDWVQEYRGDLGIALTDTVGMRAFLEDFDLYFAKLFDGLRHDSGDPFAWGEQAIAHYRKLRINPHTKRLVFSDGLNLERALALWRHFAPISSWALALAPI